MVKNHTIIAIAAALAALAYMNNDIFIDFADEGFLWYGASHLLKGEVPIRDFQAYDPGRYYWASAVLAFLGDRLMALRFAAGLFQFFALCLGLAVLRRALRSGWALFGAGMLAVFFMLIPCRYFDAGIPLIALFFAVRLGEEPSSRRHFEAGTAAGLVFFFGFNHGFYVLAATVVWALYIHQKIPGIAAAKKIRSFLCGLLLGSVPFWMMMMAYPGFTTAYMERIGLIGSAVSAGMANVSFTIPWPWTVRWEDLNPALPSLSARLLEFTNHVSIGALFLFVIAYYAIAVPAVLRMKRFEGAAKKLFAASVFVGFFYLRHVFSRSDLCYLGEGIFPVIAGLASYGRFARRKSLAHAAMGLFVLLSLLSAGLVNQITFKTMTPREAMVGYPLRGDRIWVLPADAAYIDGVKNLVAEHVRPEEPILLSPLLTTFYPILEKDSPVHEIYFHISPTIAMQQRVVRQLQDKNVVWAIVGNLAMDGRPEQTLSHSHPLLWDYLMKHFDVVSKDGLRPGYYLMKRKF